MRLAITGATGFVGTRLTALARESGHTVAALTRRPQPAADGIAWITGSLETPDALAALVDGADAVIHVAGVVNARDRAGFAAGNVDGTRAMLAAAEGASVRRFVHVSSLSARMPDLSNYGWSKHAAEALVTASSADWDIVRPPAVYGPGDMEMRDLFRLARRGLALLPPHGRLSVIDVEDLARLLIALAGAPATRAVYEPDDGMLNGWSHGDFACAIGVAVGTPRMRTLTLPRRVLDIGARLDTLFRGGSAKLTRDRVGYICHPDWVVDPARRPPSTLWTPAIATPDGLAATAAWYRARALL